MSLERTAALLGLLLAACSDARARQVAGAGVLVIVIDGLRADHLGSFGYDRDTTPELDEFALKGVVFEHAYTTAPWLLPAHVSLLTGCDPLIARRNLPDDIPPSPVTLWNVPPSVPHLARELLRHHYDTAAFLDHPQIAPVHGLAHGFETFAEFDSAEYEKEQERGVAGVTRRFRQWLAERQSDANWFAYLQVSDLLRVWNESDPVWDTHFAPRPELSFVPPVADAPRSFFAIPRTRWSGGMRTLGEYEAEYDGALRRIDQALGRMLKELESSGRIETTTVVITSSHGMGFGEAGLMLDHGTLSDADLHVPLIVRPAKSVPCARGSRSAMVVSAIDVAPTVLALERVNVPSDMHGISLARALAGAVDEQRRYVFARGSLLEGWVAIDARYCFESTSPWKSDDRQLLLSWYGGEPSQRVPREVLHDRELDHTVGHASSSPLYPRIVGPMGSAAAEWEARVESLRKRARAGDWLERSPDDVPKKP